MIGDRALDPALNHGNACSIQCDGFAAYCGGCDGANQWTQVAVGILVGPCCRAFDPSVVVLVKVVRASAGVGNGQTQTCILHSRCSRDGGQVPFEHGDLVATR